MSFEGKALRSECATPGLSVHQRKRIVFAFRDFPANCGPPKRLSSEVMKISNQFKLQDSNDKEFDPETGAELLQTFSQDAFDDARLFDASKASVCETTKLPNKVPHIDAKVHQIRRGISAIRSFPPGCGRKTMQAYQEAAPKFIVPTARRSDRNMIKVMETRDSGHLKNVAVTSGDSNVFHSYSRSSGIEEKMGKKDKTKHLSGKLSGHDSKNTSRRKAPTLELPGHRVIVQALMAAPHCPWRLGRRLQKQTKLALMHRMPSFSRNRNLKSLL